MLAGRASTGLQLHSAGGRRGPSCQATGAAWSECIRNQCLSVNLQLPHPGATCKISQPLALQAAKLDQAPTGAQQHSELADIRWPTPDESPPFWQRPLRKASSTGSSSHPATQRDSNPLHIVHVTAEMAPIAKVGGLGDVVTGLARACLQRGHQVEVILPFYECLPEHEIEGLQHQRDFDCPKGRIWDGQLATGTLRTSIHTGRIDGIPVILLRPDWSACNIFRGGRIYGGSCSELEAYLYLCRASLEYLKTSGTDPHVVHVHEWQTSALPMLYWEAYHGQGLSRARMILTIHCMDNPGECREDEFATSGLPGSVFASVDKALDERTIGHNPERLCLMKGGIIYSNAVTTVSPGYAHECMQGGAAGFLHSTLAQPHVRPKFQGILNGIDNAFWDAATDPMIPASFSQEDMSGKAVCKRYLQKGLGMRESDGPLVACVTRLVPQKGIHLIQHAVHRTAEQGGQFVLLGTGHLDGVFRGMAEGPFKDHNDVRLMLLYSETLAHLIYAAADIVLVPSMFEPCGLTQLIAMRYGALPLVRRTGGLADTVHDCDGDPAIANGFVFDGVDEHSLDTALHRALQSFRDRPGWWRQIAQKNMALDFSWAQSAEQYISTYNSILDSQSS